LGEYSDQSEIITRVFELVKESLGELPLFDSEQADQENEAPQNKKEIKTNENKV
jgi:hypothetical protein